VTATCEFGRHDDPLEISSAEHALLKENSGCIGLVTTARPVNSSTNFDLNQAFYEALFQKEEGTWLTIGEIFRRTKNNSTSGVANRNFSLLGDPSMILALPQKDIVVDQIVTNSGSDTLKALSKVIVKGRVTKGNGTTDEAFDGTALATLFDKRTEFETIGKNNPSFRYTQWFNPLFRGTATVSKGVFEFSFILPKNIAYEVNPGKLSLYAHNQKGDATGGSSAFKIGGSEPNPAADNTPPVIRAYMGDSTFVDGGTVSTNTMLVVSLSDDSGINISNYGIGNTMMATLDNDEGSFRINEYFVADTDDHTKGWVHFPIYGLDPGPHTLKVKGWDTHNNPGEANVHFVVSGDAFLIEEIGNYPNPFQSETTVFFTHNRAGEDLIAQLTILNSAGMEVNRFTVEVPSSPFRVDILRFEEHPELVKKLSPGLYFARLTVRSVTDGAESMRVTKLIMAN
jgi:hypothetical protein